MFDQSRLQGLRISLLVFRALRAKEVAATVTNSCSSHLELADENNTEYARNHPLQNLNPKQQQLNLKPEP